MPPIMHTILPAVSALPANPHYTLLGGETALRRLVERFYALMEQLPQARTIRAMHPSDLSHSRQQLFMFLSGWLGGPALYQARSGSPRLRQSHLKFAIDGAARDAWMACMTQALEEQIGDAALRTQIRAAFFKTADFMCNQ